MKIYKTTNIRKDTRKNPQKRERRNGMRNKERERRSGRETTSHQTRGSSQHCTAPCRSRDGLAKITLLFCSSEAISILHFAPFPFSPGLITLEEKRRILSSPRGWSSDRRRFTKGSEKGVWILRFTLTLSGREVSCCCLAPFQDPDKQWWKVHNWLCFASSRLATCAFISRIFFLYSFLLFPYPSFRFSRYASLSICVSF